jgi:hypothetical protein
MKETRMPSVIFAIECRENGFAFVGHSVDYRHRWRAYRSELNKGMFSVTEMLADWRKYGASAFTLRVLEALPEGTDPVDVRKITSRWRAHFARVGRLYNIPMCPLCRRPHGFPSQGEALDAPRGIEA